MIPCLLYTSEYFLVPAENYKEALQAATGLKVISVDNLEEALNFLRTLSLIHI